MIYRFLNLKYEFVSSKYSKPRCLSPQNNSLNAKNHQFYILLFLEKIIVLYKKLKNDDDDDDHDDDDNFF